MKKILLLFFAIFGFTQVYAQGGFVWDVDTTKYVNYILPKYYSQGCYYIEKNFSHSNFQNRYTEIIVQPYKINNPIALKGIAVILDEWRPVGQTNEEFPSYLQIWDKDLNNVISQVRYDTIPDFGIADIRIKLHEFYFDSTIYISDSMFYIGVKFSMIPDLNYSNMLGILYVSKNSSSCDIEEYPYLLTKGKETDSWIPLEEYTTTNGTYDDNAHNVLEFLIMPILGEVEQDTTITDSTDTNSYISQIDLERMIAVQPNPTKGEVVISCPEPVREVALLNPMGQVLYRENYNQKRITLDLSTYPQGVYILHLQTSSGEVRKKIVKE